MARKETSITFRLSFEDASLIRQGMQQSGETSLSAYILGVLLIEVKGLGRCLSLEDRRALIKVQNELHRFMGLFRKNESLRLNGHVQGLQDEEAKLKTEVQAFLKWARRQLENS